MALTFIGYRGSGKSTVGRAVAERLGRPFCDADVELERRAGMTIREIFASVGEAGFRGRERQLLSELLADPVLVLAAGGGAVLNDETRLRMAASGPVIYLEIDAEAAAARIAADPTTATRRPALTALDPIEEIRTLLVRRTPLYAEVATLTLAATRPVTELVAAVLSHLAAPATDRADAAVLPKGP